MMKLSAAMILVALCISSCSKCGLESSENAKKAAFESASAPEKTDVPFDPKLFGTDPEVTAKMFEMTVSEATRRMGSFSFRQTYKMDWIGPERSRIINGSDEIDQLKNGDFRAVTRSDAGTNAEFMMVGGKFFGNSGAGWRLLPADRNETLSIKQNSFASLASFWQMFKGMVRFSDEGEADWRNRRVRAYGMSLDTRPGGEPPPGANRAVAVSGRVLVDERIRTIVKADYRGELVGGKKGNVTIKIDYRSELYPLKADTALAPPAVSPEPKRQRIEKDPLGKFEGGKGEGRKNAQGQGAAGGQKPGEEDSEGGE